jgi:hypothetical protein
MTTNEALASSGSSTRIVSGMKRLKVKIRYSAEIGLRADGLSGLAVIELSPKLVASLTDAQRKELAPVTFTEDQQSCGNLTDIYAYFKTPGNMELPPCDGDLDAQIVDLLNRRLTIQAANRQALLDANRQKVDELLVWAASATPRESCYTRKDEKALTEWGATIEEITTIRGAVAEEKAAEEKAAEQKTAEREAAVAKEKAEKAAAEAVVLDWIEVHGSKKLKLLVAEQISYQGVYESERRRLERGDWDCYENVCGYLDEVRGTRVTEKMLAELAALRATVPDVKLEWLRLDDAPDKYHVGSFEGEDGDVQCIGCDNCEGLVDRVVFTCRHLDETLIKELTAPQG